MSKAHLSNFQLASYDRELSAVIPYLETEGFKFRCNGSVYDPVERRLAGIHIPDQRILAFQDSRLEEFIDLYFENQTIN